MSPRSGRPRNTSLDEAILDAARELLMEGGIEALSFVDVARLAGTTRPAVYRRYSAREDLAVAALGSIAARRAPVPTGDHRRDLEAELASFREGITDLRGLELTALVLSRAAEERVKEAYRVAVVEPRRARIAAIFDRAAVDGCIDAPPADRTVAVTMCTGSWYGYAVAGETPPAAWARRVATLVWRSLGGAA